VFSVATTSTYNSGMNTPHVTDNINRLELMYMPVQVYGQWVD